MRRVHIALQWHWLLTEKHAVKRGDASCFQDTLPVACDRRCNSLDV